MKASAVIQVLIVLVFSIRFSIAQVMPKAPTSAPLAKPVAISAAAANSGGEVPEADEINYWLIRDEMSRWSADEAEILEQVLRNSFDALAANGIDGVALLDGYRFRHYAGRFVDDIEGRMAKIDHNVGEITLSDAALTVQQGFAIYHELGHAVDYQMDRQVSESYHNITGGSVAREEDTPWQTAENYWLREGGRDDREEAVADAFAVLVMVSHAGLRRPVFAHQPVTTDYQGILAALAQALQTG